LEASKGVLVLLAAVGLLSLRHRDVGAMAGDLVQGLQLNPDHPYPLLLLHVASHVTSAHLRNLAGGALAYATLRFMEAYGLWHQRAWAEWLAIFSAGLYLPWECYEVAKRGTIGAAVVLVFNLVIVLYLLSCRLEAWRAKGGVTVSDLVTPDEQVPGQCG
jgi:uncharacterized membrane protein (DUF2068 family)